MVYSHIWDALLKLATLFVVIIVAIWIGLEGRVEAAGLVAPGNIKVVVVVIVAIVWALLYRQVMSIFASWLYARLSLGANVSLQEAKALRKLFQLDFSFQWLPLKDIKKLPKEQRHDAVLQALNAYGPRRKAMLF